MFGTDELIAIRNTIVEVLTKIFAAIQKVLGDAWAGWDGSLPTDDEAAE